jgi:transitional endoplasmic reticulum ATPase
LLNEMDGISPFAHVVVIGATNRPDMLDAALLRPGRFDEVLSVELPDAAARDHVLRIHTQAMPLDDDVRLDELASACDAWSGAQLSALCREAGMHALRDGLRDDATRVAHRHFTAAMGRVHSTS